MRYMQSSLAERLLGTGRGSLLLLRLTRRIVVCFRPRPNSASISDAGREIWCTSLSNCRRGLLFRDWCFVVAAITGGEAKYGAPYGDVLGIGAETRFWLFRERKDGDKMSEGPLDPEPEGVISTTAGAGLAGEVRRREKQIREGDGDAAASRTSGAVRLRDKAQGSPLPLARFADLSELLPLVSETGRTRLDKHRSNWNGQ